MWTASRLYPVIAAMPPRVANRDTVLPIGGGPEGKEPLFVPKGTKVMFSQWTSNRRKDIWGEDADVFEPNRWESLRPGWVVIVTLALGNNVTNMRLRTTYHSAEARVFV